MRHVRPDISFYVSHESLGDVFPETVRCVRVVFQIFKSGVNILKDFPRINTFVDIDPRIRVAGTDADQAPMRELRGVDPFPVMECHKPLMVKGAPFLVSDLQIALRCDPELPQSRAEIPGLEVRLIGSTVRQFGFNRDRVKQSDLSLPCLSTIVQIHQHARDSPWDGSAVSN